MESDLPTCQQGLYQHEFYILRGTAFSQNQILCNL